MLMVNSSQQFQKRLLFFWLLTGLLIIPPHISKAATIPEIASELFTTKRLFGPGYDATTAIVSADMDNDGDLDLVVGNGGEQSAVYLNDGQGRFASGPFTCGVTPNVRCFSSGGMWTSSVAVADVDNDGDLDIIAGNNSAGGRASQSQGRDYVYLNDGAGNFYFGVEDLSCSLPKKVRCIGGGHGNTEATSYITSSVLTGDLDNDGDYDIVVGNLGLLEVDIPPNGTLVGEQDFVYLNDGLGNFAYAETVSCTTAAVRCFGTGADRTLNMALHDINADGLLDIVAGNEAQQSVVYLNQKTTPGTFYKGATNCANGAALGIRCFGPQTSKTYSLAVGDINNDRLPDIVAGNGDGMIGDAGAGQQNVVYLNLGAGSFAAGAIDCAATGSMRCVGTTDQTYEVDLADIDMDQDLDIVVGNMRQQSGVFLNQPMGNASGFFYRGSDCSNAGILCFGSPSHMTEAGAVADVNGDGNLDLIAGNNRQQNGVYLNTHTSRYVASPAFGDLNAYAAAVEFGDVNNDGSLDIVTGNQIYDLSSPKPNGIFLNNGKGSFPALPSSTFGTGIDRTVSLALGDMNGDGYLDIITGNDQYDGPPIDTSQGNARNAIYFNNRSGGFYKGGQPCAVTARVRCFGSLTERTSDVAVGDLDADGDLDLITANADDIGISSIYFNDGLGNLASAVPFSSVEARTRKIALGDVDGDGDLDIITATSAVWNYIFLNDGAGHFHQGPINCGVTLNVRCFAAGMNHALAVTTGDVDNDGDLDIAIGIVGWPNYVFFNDGAGNFPTFKEFGTGGDKTASLDMGDTDSDGDLDIAVGNFQEQNVIYLNDGTGSFEAEQNIGALQQGNSVIALGNVDNDGDLDVVDVKGNYGAFTSVVYSNTLSTVPLSINSPPRVSVRQPVGSAQANKYASPAIIASTVIPISYTLTDRESDRVDIVASYSLNGGGLWKPAFATTGTVTRNLQTTPAGLRYIFPWDTFASGFFGASDNVVFRIQVMPSKRPIRGGAPEIYQFPALDAKTFPFRVRGTQVRVLQNGSPAKDSLVYRLPAGQNNSYKPYADSTGVAFRTDSRGYLRGRGELKLGDRLVSMQPISSTENYAVYYTSAKPVATGLQPYTVSQAGVQQLPVSAANPLVIFTLTVSLEWDARNDSQFLEQLRLDLQRSSEALYDWSNGQVVLGNVSIYQNREHWNDADVRIYASNRLRPNADQGGIVPMVRNDPTVADKPYIPGQIRMGAVWNRFGDVGANLAADWSLTLAHEIGHYALYLDDNYLGLDQNGMLTQVSSCPGVMSDPYRNDAFSEFHPDSAWSAECANTLSNQEVGRSDWSTIHTFYPWLRKPTGSITDPNDAGPNFLPLAITQVRVVNPSAPSTTLAVPIFYLTSATGGTYEPGATARAILFQEDSGRLVDLGRPSQNQVLARGARVGDTLCVYEPSLARTGCEVLSSTDDHLTIQQEAAWKPDIVIEPTSATNFVIRVQGVQIPAGATLKARLYPTDAVAAPAATLSIAGNEYRTSIALASPALAGYVRLWVETPTGVHIHENITDYNIGGNPGYVRSRPTMTAPILSTDGQAMLVAENLAFNPDAFFALQSISTLPTALPGRTLVGQGYRVLRSANAPALDTVSLSVNYLGREVPSGEEAWVNLYFWNGTTWEQLPTTRDLTHNIVSAPAHRPGVYAVMSSLQIMITRPGWNLVAYPAHSTRAITNALQSIDDGYNLVYSYDPVALEQPWQVYDPTLSPTYTWVNTLHEMTFGHGYWIQATQPMTWYIQNTALPLPGLTASTPTTGLYPPATYYGEIQNQGGFLPKPGMLVEAMINGKICGRGRTQAQNGRIVYSVSVDSGVSVGAANGCGVADAPISIVVNGRLMPQQARWDNTKLTLMNLSIPGYNTFLPLIRTR